MNLITVVRSNGRRTSEAMHSPLEAIEALRNGHKVSAEGKKKIAQCEPAAWAAYIEECKAFKAYMLSRMKR